MRSKAQQQPEGKKMTTQAPETKIVEAYRVACDGGEGALGHPRVWLQSKLEPVKEWDGIYR